MGSAMNILLNEHRFLGTMLNFTQELADRMRRGEPVQPPVLGRAGEFFRVCLEGCLLAKEENILFTKLQSKGFSRQTGLIASMLVDHERGRRLVREMKKAAADYEAGSGAAGGRWAAAALDFVDLMRAHLKEEETSLFMMADIFMQPSEQAQLAEEFKRLEEAQTVSGRHRLIHRMPDELSGETKERAMDSLGSPSARASSGVSKQNPVGIAILVVVRNLRARSSRHNRMPSVSSLLEMQIRSILRVCLLAAALGVAAAVGAAQGGRFEIVTGKLFETAVPRDFYLEGNAIPVEKWNAVLIRTPSGARALFALIATAGFASEIQQKYSGMLTSEGHLAICGKAMAVGSYGFGIRRPRLAGQQALFFVYNQAGKRIMECSMENDLSLREPRPLQVVIESSHSARLYLGRYSVGLSP